MSATDSVRAGASDRGGREGAHPAAQALFEHMMTIAERLRREGRAYFALKPDAAAATYYKARAATSMTPADFRLEGGDSPAALEKALIDLWQRQGCPELAELAPAIARLAEELRLRETETDEVSPFVYAMF